MATLDDLPQLVATDPQLREDLVATIAAFCQRHGIEASSDDFDWLAGDDTAGQRLAAGTGGLGVFIYRDGPSYSRWIDTGLVSPSPTGQGPTLDPGGLGGTLNR
ncbi:MAG: hypothetical protein AB7R89_32990 [Dehalococcoidia bacterium]